MSADAYAFMCALGLGDGRRLGDALVDEQRQCVERFLDPTFPPYQYWTFARGWGKTTLQAALAVAEMLTTLPPGSRLYCLAADLDQGRLLVDSIESFHASTPELAGAFDVQASRVVATRTGSVLTVLPADAPSAFGLRPDRLFIDEYAWWPETDGARRLYDATTTALAKTNGRLLICTTASDPTHRAYKTLLQARDDPLWQVHEQPGPPPWMDTERIEAERRRLLPSMFERLFENVWATGEGRLTTRDDVEANVGHAGDLAFDPQRRYVAALDVGLVNDRTAAIVAHSEQRDGGVVVVVDRLAVWEGTRAKPVELAEVEHWITEACRAYHAPLVYDVFQAAHLTQRLRVAGIRVEQFVFSQSNIGRLALVLYELLRDRLLDLPDNEALIDELSAVRLVERSPGVVRIDHDSDRHDDQVIALGMAAATLVRRPTGPATVHTELVAAAGALPGRTQVFRSESRHRSLGGLPGSNPWR